MVRTDLPGFFGPFITENSADHDRRVDIAGAATFPDRQLFRIAVDPTALSVIDEFPGGTTVQLVNG